MVALEATYLAWIDARETGMADVVERLEAAGVDRKSTRLNSSHVD